MWYMKECSVASCPNKHRSSGFCLKHYHRFRKHGDPLRADRDHHGLTLSPEYSVWKGMKRRTGDPKNKEYKNYGARGIRVCDRWANSFRLFYEDMGARPSPTHSIDRIDNDGNYEPSNCRWATLKEQRANQRPPKVHAWVNIKKVKNSYAVRAGVGHSGIHVKTYRYGPEALNCLNFIKQQFSEHGPYY